MKIADKLPGGVVVGTLAVMLLVDGMLIVALAALGLGLVTRWRVRTMLSKPADRILDDQVDRVRETVAQERNEERRKKLQKEADRVITQLQERRKEEEFGISEIGSLIALGTVAFPLIGVTILTTEAVMAVRRPRTSADELQVIDVETAEAVLIDIEPVESEPIDLNTAVSAAVRAALAAL